MKEAYIVKYGGDPATIVIDYKVLQMSAELNPAFKGMKTEAVKAAGSNIYKYVTAKSSTKDGASSQLSAVRKKFPEAFVVEVDGDNVTRCK